MVLSLIALCLAGCSAGAEERALWKVSANVVAGEEIAVIAPVSGQVSDCRVGAGDRVPAGQTLFQIKPQTLYSPVNGRVAAIYAQPGDDAADSTQRYGGVMLIERADRYELKCQTTTGVNSELNRNLYVGAQVWLKTKGKKFYALGVISYVDGTDFTVAVQGDTLSFRDEVHVCHTENLKSNEPLAKAKLSVVQPVKITFSGTLVSLQTYVGAEVTKGEPLLDYTPEGSAGELSQAALRGSVGAAEALIIRDVRALEGAYINAKDTLCTAYRVSELRLRAYVSENAVKSLRVGQRAELWLGQDGEEKAGVGEVAAISWEGIDEAVAQYAVYVTSRDLADARIGSHYTVSFEP